MTTLRNALAEVAEERAAAAAPHDPDLSRGLWRAGRRRRIEGRLAGGVVALVIGLVALVATDLLPSQLGARPAARDGGHLTYPQRIGSQLWVGTLAERPGRMAGLVQVYDDASIGWQAVAPSGTRYRIPDLDPQAEPAISPDGRRIAYAKAGSKNFRIHDLESGNSWVFRPEADAGVSAFSPQLPTFFSPSGNRLAAFTNGSVNVFDVSSGEGSRAVGLTFAYGWLDDDHLIGSSSTAASHDPFHTLELVVLDVRSGALSAPFVVKAPSGTQWSGQWAIQVRSDGVLVGRFAEGPPTKPDGTYEIRAEDEYLYQDQARGFRLTGATVTPVALGPAGYGKDAVHLRTDGPCSLASLDDGRIAAPVRDSADGFVTARVEPDRLVPVVVVRPRASCVLWAADAIGGAPTPSLFGTSDLWIAWWWHELALGAVLVLAGVLRRRRVGRSWQSGVRE